MYTIHFRDRFHTFDGESTNSHSLLEAEYQYECGVSSQLNSRTKRKVPTYYVLATLCDGSTLRQQLTQANDINTPDKTLVMSNKRL